MVGRVSRPGEGGAASPSGRALRPDWAAVPMRYAAQRKTVGAVEKKRERERMAGLRGLAFGVPTGIRTPVPTVKG